MAAFHEPCEDASSFTKCHSMIDWAKKLALWHELLKSPDPVQIKGTICLLSSAHKLVLCTLRTKC